MTDSAPAPVVDPEACWVDREIGEAPLNAPRRYKTREAEIAWRLHCLEMWPEVAQLKLSEQRRIYDVDIEMKQEAIDKISLLTVELMDEDKGPGTMTLVVVSAACVLGGIILGGAAVILATDRL